ncbi:MAG: DUF4337 domain-containing protein [Actinomycetota bacterium]
MEAHETHEAIHEAHAGHHHHKHPNAKRVAILISVLAALLAIVEMGGKSAQNTSVAANIEAANLWAFFQAKTVRMTTMRTAADALDTVAPPGLPPEAAAAWAKRSADWRATLQRYESEPETGEGRKELAARAKAAEAKRDHALAAYHLFEYGAAALQLAIPLASAAVVTGMIALAWVAAGLGGVGTAFALLAWLAPTLIHL